MADGSGKIALGAGLMSFGQGIGQAMSAAEQRKQSLEEIRQRFQQSVALMDMRNDAALEREQVRWDREAPERDARLGLIGAQTESAQALADHRRAAPDGPQLFGLADPRLYTSESMARASRVLENGGSEADAREVLREREGGGLFEPDRVAGDAMRMADVAFGQDPWGNEEPVPTGKQVSTFLEHNPGLAEQAGIQPDDSLPVAKRKYAQWYTQSYLQNPNPPASAGGGLMGGSGGPGAASYEDIIGDLNTYLQGGSSVEDDQFGPNQWDQWSND